RENRVLLSFRETLIPAARSNSVLAGAGYDSTCDSLSAAELLRRPGVSLDSLVRAAPELLEVGANGGRAEEVARGGQVGAAEAGADELLVAVEVELKYEGYVVRERERAERLRAQAEFSLPEELDYAALITITREAREKLSRARPLNLAQAGRIPGVS